MLSAILSDTLLLKSPTTIPKDRVLAKKLAKVAKVSLQKYGNEMLEAGCDAIKHSANKIILTDFKTYRKERRKIGISQAPVIGFKKIMERKEELLKELSRLQKKNNYVAMFLMITDIIAGDSYLFFAGNESKIKPLFKKKVERIGDLKGGIIFLKKVVSRKKQVQLKVLELL